MLDMKRLSADPAGIAQLLAKKGPKISLDRFCQLDQERKAILVQVEEMKAKRNAVSKEIGMKKKAGEDATETMAAMRALGDEIAALDDRLRQVEEGLQQELLAIPNLPHASVPEGLTEADNVQVRTWGDKPLIAAPKDHWDIGEALDILDFDRAAKISGARFAVYKGAGAQLERALINYFLNSHAAKGYTEIFPPYLVNTASMTGTGQLPKFSEDMFHVEGSDYYLIPTGEVPLTNLHREEILSGDQLPIYYAGYTACFRAEAGAAGRDTRGLIRLHQFNKVELVKFVKPEDSYDELEKLTHDAESLLQGLGLSYRVMALCGGDLSFTSAKTYDLEVWMPGYGGYREISSCSNFEDFQARRANIKFRREAKAKPELVHTLNGSGLAVGRTVAAILENYLQPDGSVKVPDILRPYMGGLEYIR